LNKAHTRTAANKAKAARAFSKVWGFILTPPKLRFDGKKYKVVKQSFGSEVSFTVFSGKAFASSP